MDLENLSVGNAALIGVFGYLVVFIGIVLLMLIIYILGGIMKKADKRSEAKAALAAESAANVPLAVKKEPAPGSAGDIALYGTDPKDAAMVMAIVADELGVPVNELRFKSIKEVKENEV